MTKFLLLAGMLLFPGISPAQTDTVIRSESRLVIVDAVVTDKRGAYLRDLTAKDFRVLEDKQERAITTFSFDASPPDARSPQPHSIVLFFDNSSLNAAEEARARQAALAFIESDMARNRMIAIVNFGRSLQITQNFTDDAPRVKSALADAASLAASSNANVAPLNKVASDLNKAVSDFGARGMILSVRTLALNLGAEPGRKTLILFTSGSPVTTERTSEVTAAIDASNKSNVAIYPIDIRDQTANSGLDPSSASPPRGRISRANPNGAARDAAPNFPNSSGPNQQPMYLLAQGTGGFVTDNPNDLPLKLEKIGKEAHEQYLLGYVPGASEPGTCHTLQVKVNRGNAVVRARSRYCNVKPLDALAGNPIEKQLESHAAASETGSMAASMQAPFFYRSEDVARVNVAVEIAAESLKFEKIKGKSHSTVNVLGIVYRQDGGIGARFSDTVNIDLENEKELKAFKERSFQYENQFDVVPGKYNLKVVFNSSGGGFGKLEAPLTIDSYDARGLGLSALVFSREFHKSNDLGAGLDMALIEDRTPLIVQGLQIVPAGSVRFKKTDPALVYLEIYRPLRTSSPAPQTPVTLQIRMLDAETGEEKLTPVVITIPNPAEESGNPMIPYGLRLPFAQLGPGSYRLEVTATDGAARLTRTGAFQLE